MTKSNKTENKTKSVTQKVQDAIRLYPTFKKNKNKLMAYMLKTEARECGEFTKTELETIARAQYARG